MAVEKIEVGYRNIGTMGGVDYHHKFLLYTDKSGNQHTISGWTDEANTSKELPFGKIRVLADAPYNSENPDSAERHPDQKQYRETITEGADLSAKWSEMVENAKTKDNLYPYDPIRQNSNTLADSVLNDAGLKQPTQDGITGHLAPGSGKPLDKDVKPRSSEDLGISNIGEAISLNNNQPAPTEFQLALAPESQQLLKDSERHVRALTDRHQLAWDQGMDNTVHAVALEAREQGMTGIDHLKVKDGQIRFAQQDGFGIREGQVDARTAANTDAADSRAQMASADQREQTNAQTQASHQYAEARTPEAPVMSV
ncbi:XVIPCD domain-containing protein [Hydrogenophaga sp. RWCD_12]|uniref:XVIPCD domain-containing protein n=1 Tax=Hydrogenophaga sp. RWCD_12 TaxID=3391190 RepID=UPI0039846901